MRKQILLTAVAPLILASVAMGQPGKQQSFRANITGRGGDQGKCTVEVVVDGTVEIEIRGDRALLRNLAGNPPQWRRFECNGVMPDDPVGFRFAGVDGRGSQQLVRDPRNGGPAVVRIDDPKGGAEGYTFDIFWGGNYGGPGNGPGYPPPPGGGSYPPGGGSYPPGGNRYTREQAIRACQDSVAGQARDRWRNGNVQFRRIDIDDQPNRNDWVVGSFAVRFGGGREEDYRFSCSVDFRSGRIRSAQIEDNGGNRPPEYGGGGSRRAMDNCQSAVQQRLRRDGYEQVDFRSINVDTRPGRGAWIVGDLRANGRNRDAFDFSCQVNLNDGDIRSVDVVRK